MKLLGEETSFDGALPPIGDNHMTCPDESLGAVRLFMPRLVIPMHYTTSYVIQQDSFAFSEKARGNRETGMQS